MPFSIYYTINQEILKILHWGPKPGLNWKGPKPLGVEGPITIRRTPLPTFLVNFSTFAFLLNYSFMKYRKHQSFRDRGCICITTFNNRDFYVHRGIYLKEYIGISTFSYTILFPPVLHNFLQKISVYCGNKLCTRRKLCNTGGTMLHGQKTACHKTGIRQGYLVIVGSFE